MRLQPLQLIVAIGAGFLSYVQLVTAAVAALPVQAEVGASSPQALVARGGGSSVEGGYYNLCHYYPTVGEIEGKLHMIGQCASKQSDPQKTTWMDLNPCYANIDGSLFPVTDGKGDFFKTCRDCHIPIDADLPRKLMRCTCERYAGDKEGKETQVDMDQHVHVFEDKLGCPGAEGFIA